MPQQDKQPQAREQAEKPQTPKPSAQQRSSDIVVALQITERILGIHREAGTPIDKKAIYSEVASTLQTLADERTADITAETEDRYHYFIAGGRKALEQELKHVDNDPSLSGDLEKNKKKEALVREYAQTRIVQKVALAQVTEFLLGSLLDPCQPVEQLAERTQSIRNDAGEWSSSFDPNTIEQGIGKMIAPTMLQEVRAGIQLALQMRQQVNELLQKHRGFDGRPDAKAIIEEVYGKKLTGRARVVAEGPLSITIVIPDEADYNLVHGAKNLQSSGGFHGNYLARWHSTRGFGNQYDTLGHDLRGLINVAKGYESIGTIDHENEHSLYEIIMHNRGKKADVMQSMTANIAVMDPKQYERVVETAFKEAMFESGSRAIPDFANEVMAYVLNNESVTTPTEQIVASNVRRLTEDTLYEHLHLAPERIQRMRTELLGSVGDVRKNGPVDAKTEAALQLFEQKVAATVQKDALMKIYRSIVDAVARLYKAFPDKKNYIRAVLTGENPMKWPDIADAIASKRWKKGDLSAVFAEVHGNTKYREGKYAQQQMNAAWALIHAFEDGTMAESSTPAAETEARGGVCFTLREGETADYYFSLSSGRNMIITSRNDEGLDHHQLRNEDGTNVFGGEFANIQTPVDVGGVTVAKVGIRTPSGAQKHVYMKEGRALPIGIEYADVGDAVSVNGKLIFAAQREDSLWQIVDEEGRAYGEPTARIARLQVENGKWFALTQQENGYSWCNENGLITKPTHGALPNFTLTHVDGATYLCNGKEVVTEDGESLPSPVENTLTVRTFAGSSGLILFFDANRLGHVAHLFFQHSGETLSAKKITHVADTNPPIFKMVTGETQTWVDDMGKTLAMFPIDPNLEITPPINGERLFSVRGSKVLKHASGEPFNASQDQFDYHILPNEEKTAAYVEVIRNEKSSLLDAKGKTILDLGDESPVGFEIIDGKDYVYVQNAQSRIGFVDMTGRRIMNDADYIIGIGNGMIFWTKGNEIHKTPLIDAPKPA